MVSRVSNYFDATGIDDPRIENLQSLVAAQSERIREQHEQMEFYTSLHLWDILLTAALFGGIGIVAGLAIACVW